MKRDRIIYWISTGIFCLIMLFSATMYFFMHDMAVSAYESLGFPTWMIYPSAIVKLLGILAVLSNRSKLLKEWAYAGFFFDAAMAMTSHIIAQDGGYGAAALVLVCIVVSRIYHGKIYS